MGAVRIIVLIVAAVAAIGLFIVVQRMAGRKATPVPVAVAAPVARPSVQVLTAKHDMTIGQRITMLDLSWQPFPAETVNAAWITGGPYPATTGARLEDKATKAAAVAIGEGGPMQPVLGAIVREPLLAGEPIVERKIVRGGQGGYMSVVLTPGMRAVAVPVNVESGAGGFILPGDRVDVVVSRKLDQGSNQGGQGGVTSETVLQNIRVLAIDQQVSPVKDAKTIVGAAATLEVPSGDVEVLIKARASGELALSLRSYAALGAAVGMPVGRGNSSQAVRVVRAGRASEAYVR